MDNASKNASDMINRLTMQYNRGRQAAITNELVDIITGTCCQKRFVVSRPDLVFQVPVRSKRSTASLEYLDGGVLVGQCVSSSYHTIALDFDRTTFFVAMCARCVPSGLLSNVRSSRQVTRYVKTPCTPRASWWPVR